MEQQLGHQHSTVYRLLQRHQWRKIKPDHPKTDPEEQAELASFAQQVQQISAASAE